MLYVKAIMCTIKRRIFANALKTYHLIMVKNVSLATYHNTGTLIIIYVNGVLKTQSIILIRKNASLVLIIHQLLINWRWSALPALKNMHLTHQEANVLALRSIVHPARFTIAIKRSVNVQWMLHSKTVLHVFLVTSQNIGTIIIWAANSANRILFTIQA